MKPIIAIFDFDGTLTRCDTFNDILVWYFGKTRFFLYLFCVSPLIFLYLIRILPNDAPKQTLFWLLFRGIESEKFSKICSDYAAKRLPNIVRSDALTKLLWHLNMGHRVIINSASLADWILPWATNCGDIEVFATVAQSENGCLTGKFAGQCNYGYAKKRALNQVGINQESYVIYAYGDSRGDIEMLSEANYPNYRIFKG